jgi:fructose-specific phosphotransferase system IIC component
MSLYPMLAAVCVGLAVTGLLMVGVGIYGRVPSESPFRSRLTRVRRSGALTSARSRLTKIMVAFVAGRWQQH